MAAGRSRILAARPIPVPSAGPHICRLLQGDKNDEFVVEMWKPYVSDDVKRLIVRGYQADKDVLHRVSILEKFLFAKFPDWSRLYLWPDHLLYVEDCILHAKGARNVVLALFARPNPDLCRAHRQANRGTSRKHG